MMRHDARTGRRIGLALMTMAALMAGACRRESFDDAWQRQSRQADQSASAMERDMQARLRVAQAAGQDMAAGASEADTSAP
ncbi:hypothetical protein [Novosphingobium sp. KACC 22771]|uniref:hypothetical protein n=1 Tax=Novosphingobium sp. KACC 22771 TaxID=3025670 RepID=UPI00236550E4|nr:hypothetical protein [Novosphingobium sp. KACC 22771]WDF75096.1 hypothetical protein PQ467_18945 [Novosphingobium sp. KACC 22771]